MADFGAPVASGIDPSKGISTLSQLMDVKSKQIGIQQQQQALQTGQSLQQSAQANAQKDQQAMGERLKVKGMFNTGKDDQGNSILSPDGTPDPTKVLPALGRIAPLTGQQTAQDILKTLTDRVGLQSATTNLDKEQRGMLMGPIQAAAIDPTMKAADVNAGIDNLVKAHPEMGNAAGYLQGLTSHLDAAATPAERMKVIQSIAARLQTGQAVEPPKPGSIDSGAQVQPGTINQQTGAFTPGGQPITKIAPPQVATMPSGSLGIVGGVAGVPAGAGGSQAPAAGGLKAPPRTAAQDAPAPNAPRAVQEAFTQATSQANAHVEDVRKADNPLDYGNNMQIANQIRKLSKDTSTGPGTDTWHHVMGALGAPVGANNVADYQLLGAYLDRQAAGIRGAMGLPQTNEGATQSKDIAGNTGYQAKALQDKNDLTQALTEGLHQYRTGLDRVAGFSGQASPQAVNQFKSAWTQNFDPNVFKGELAYQRSKAGGDAFVKSLDPQEAKSLAAKRAALQALSRGELPQ